MTDPDVSIHPNAICESDAIGSGTRIWAFVHVLPGAVIGKDCNLCDGVFVENDVIVGDRVTIKSGVQLWDGVRIGDDAFIGPNATFTNNDFPRSRRWLAESPLTFVGEGASIGANATILPGVNIGSGAMVGAGSVVTKDVPSNAVVYGNPARIRGYASTDASIPVSASVSHDASPVDIDLPGGCRLISLDSAQDLRGSLIAVEFGSWAPFTPERFFAVYGVPSSEVRGEHAHKTCHQLLIALAGSVSVLLDDGLTRSAVALTDPQVALHIPPRVWASQFGHGLDTVLGVLASEAYDPAEYVREYSEFLEMAGTRGDARP